MAPRGAERQGDLEKGDPGEAGRGEYGRCAGTITSDETVHRTLLLPTTRRAVAAVPTLIGRASRHIRANHVLAYGFLARRQRPLPWLLSAADRDRT
jgi:hypothetical protein